MDISVIIPTRNRERNIDKCILSVLSNNVGDLKYEIIVIDNGSTDNTRTIVEHLQEEYSQLKYYYENNPGLHQARHRGARESNSHILAFIDDDVEVTEDWLTAVYEMFQEKSVSLVTGPVLPLFETTPPEWLELHWSQSEYGKTLGWLSLIDFNEGVRTIPPEFVFGCNFSIRKNILFECKGFHPDSMPEELMIYRGDGETGLSRDIKHHGYQVGFSPKATVFHFISKTRMTPKYLYRRAFLQGISYSYSQIRAGQKHMVVHFTIRVLKIFRDVWKSVSPMHPTLILVWLHYSKGFFYHQSRLFFSKNLREWVLQDCYL
jgi:glucosyl-dolichyl phosphate glucuronosyltransferase